MPRVFQALLIIPSFDHLWKSQGCIWLWSDHLPMWYILVRWLRGMIFHRTEDGDGCRSSSKRQCLMFCHYASEFLPNAAFSGSWQEAADRLSGMQHTLCPFIFLIQWRLTQRRSLETFGSGSRSPCCLWMVLMTPSFRTWELTSRRWGDCLVCVTWEFWGATEFKPFSFTAVENSITQIHGAWYYCF